MTKQKDFILWGSAGHAKVLNEIIKLNGGQVIALFDNTHVNSVLKNVPIYYGNEGFQNWIRSRNSKEVFGLAAIGGARGLDRLSIHKLFQENGICTPTIIHPSAVISESATLGSGSQVLALANVAPDSKLGDGCIINNQVNVDHECSLGDGVHLGPGSKLCGCVNIGDNAFIGAGATILPRISIGPNATIGAGAVVTKDVPAHVTVVGNPARLLNFT